MQEQKQGREFHGGGRGGKKESEEHVAQLEAAEIRMKTRKMHGTTGSEEMETF